MMTKPVTPLIPRDATPEQRKCSPLAQDGRTWRGKWFCDACELSWREAGWQDRDVFLSRTCPHCGTTGDACCVYEVPRKLKLVKQMVFDQTHIKE